jgi:hypothetical protein
MKALLKNLIKIRHLVIFVVFLSCSFTAKSAEFLVMDQEVTWDIYADTAFKWFPLGGGVPSDWSSPSDYYNGTWYIRYEVLSVATNTPFGMQFGIIQNDTAKLFEQPIQQLQGAGDVIVHGSSPSGWLKSGGGVDFSKVSEIQNLCAVIYDWNSLLPLNPGESIWSQRTKWFPVNLRITVVAVSSGSTFSGWADYLNIKKPTPDFSIDYIHELTNEAIPSTDEYSVNPDMSGAISGNGQKLALTPGQDIYFRSKANGDTLASEIQHLDVPLRPATPSISVDFTNEKTAENVSSGIEYSTSITFASPVAGAGNKVTLTPGQNLYFRVKATAGNFVSAAHLLEVPVRPAAPSFSVDYLNESTIENVGSGVEYSTTVSFTSAVTGNGSKVTLTPGQNIYFRIKATASAFSSVAFLLNVIVRPAAPYISINYILENTNQSITSNMEYSTNASFTVSSAGTGNSISVTPGQNLYFRYKATVSAFSSVVFLLNIAERPGTPSANINYPTETTVESFPATIQYSTSPSFSNPVNCSGTPILLTPGQDLYLWVKFTSSSFASLAYHLVVPNRAATAILYNIDYLNEKTVENVSSDIEYATSASFDVKNTGNGNKVTLTPGQVMYFREKAKANKFASEIYLLDVDARPAAPFINIDYFSEFTGQIITSDIEYCNNASFAGSLTGAGNRIAVSAGQDLYFKIKATDITFASEVLFLDVPSRPDIPITTIDYATEKTIESLPNTIEYSTSPTFSNPVTCTGAPISLTPGQDLYLWIKPTASSFASMDYHLVVPNRPASVFSFSINYINEETVENVSPDIEYSTSDLFTDQVSGTGIKVSLTPGQNLYFRKMATVSTFASAAFLLAVDVRPQTPSVSINYLMESTNQSITSDIEYSTSGSFTGSSIGAGKNITLVPGQDLYFRVKATSDNFVSLTYHLDVPARPAKPTASIDYVNEKTLQSFPATIEYSKSPTFTSPVSCTGTPILLTPGQDLYIWVKSTLSSFASTDYHLIVPQRPYLEYTGDDIVIADSFSITAILTNNMTGFNLSDILVINGLAKNLTNDNKFTVYPDILGEVHVLIPANSFNGASFASNEVIVYYDNTWTSVNQIDNNHCFIYPNPSNNGIIYIETTTNVPYTIDVLSSAGNKIKSIVVYDMYSQQIDLQDLHKGIYFLKITSNEKIDLHKVILK